MADKRIAVEVAYVGEQEQALLAVEADAGLTAREAVERSGILRRFPEIALGTNKLGIFGKLAKPDQVLESGDRVEIYRPLIADPKEARKKRAAEGKVLRKGGGEAEAEAD